MRLCMTRNSFHAQWGDNMKKNTTIKILYIMRTKVLLLTTLLLTTFSTQAGNNDTLKVFRVHFNQRLESVKFSGYCKVDVVGDSVEYLESNDPATSPLVKGLTYNLERDNDGNNLTVNATAGVGGFKLHLIMDAFASIKAEDYSQVQVVLPENVARLTVSAADYSEVNISARVGVDTLRLRRVMLKGEDYATVSLETPCVMDEIGLLAEDYATVNVYYCKGGTLHSTQHDRGNVNVKEQDVVCKKFSTSFSSFSDAGYDSITAENEHKVAKVCDITDDFRLDFLWGFHNWGTTPFNGLMKLDGGYALRTTFSSYQLEAVYYPLVSDHWRLGIGLGYESDVYKFVDGRVDIVNDATGTARTFAAVAPDDGEWSTKLVARCVSLPLMVRWEPGESDFFIGLAAIPGLSYNGKNTGLKHKAEYANGSYSSKDDVSKVMNSFRLDARLSIGWEHFYAFLQVATLPLNTDMDKDIYPIKLGLALSLGDD